MQAGNEEVSLEEADALSASLGSKLVWIGREPLQYIAELLGRDVSGMAQLDPEQIVSAGPNALKSMSGMVFVCYHGRSSLQVVRFLRARGVTAHSLRGGITSIVGEIF